jgi:hypothetical protein
VKHVVVANFARLSAASEAQPATCWPELSDLTLVFDRLCVIAPSIASKILANSFDRFSVGVINLRLANDHICILSPEEVSDNEYLPNQSLGSGLDGVRTSATKHAGCADTVIGSGIDALMDDQSDCLQFSKYAAIMSTMSSCNLCTDCNETTFLAALAALAALANCSITASLSEAKMDSISTYSRNYSDPGLSFVIKEVL